MARVPLRRVQIPKGTLLYHGTNTPESFTILNPSSWVSDSVHTAHWFVNWNGAREDSKPRVYKYRVKKRITGLLLIERETDVQQLAYWLEEQGYDSAGPHEMAESLCRLGFNGWHIPDNYASQGGGSDTLLCNPEEWLELDSVRDFTPEHLWEF